MKKRTYIAAGYFLVYGVSLLVAMWLAESIFSESEAKGAYANLLGIGASCYFGLLLGATGWWSIPYVFTLNSVAMALIAIVNFLFLKTLEGTGSLIGDIAMIPLAGLLVTLPLFFNTVAVSIVDWSTKKLKRT